MRTILLPTIDAAPARGGVARYIEAIVRTYPENARILKLSSLKYPVLGAVFLRHRNVDAFWIHHVLPIGTVAWLLKPFIKKPYVIFLHGMDFDQGRRTAWKRWLLKQILRDAERVVTNSRALAEEAQTFVGSDRSPLVVYPPVSDELIEASATARKGAGKVDLQKLAELAVGVARGEGPLVKQSVATDGITRLLTVSRLVERKGHLKVLQALTHFPNVHYHIVGDGPMRGTIQGVVEDLGLKDRVRFTLDANDDQLPEIYREADIFVMPTTKSREDREGFGIVYLEAQLFGLPVVATQQPGVDEAIQHEASGLLCEDTPEALNAALQRLIDDPALRARYGSRGRTRVLDHFTRERQMANLSELLA